MRSTQLRAGYVLGAIRNHLGYDHGSLGESILNHLSAFDLEVDGPIDPDPIDDPILAVADNIVSRGLPTLPSLRVERALSKDLELTEERHSKGSISFPFRENLSTDEKRLLRRTLLPIDPSLSPGDVAEDLGGHLDSDAERSFLEEGLPGVVGDWAPQVAWSQRPLEMIVPADEAHDFTDQHTDFAIQFPRPPKSEEGLVVEIDGKHHEEKGQVELDKNRNTACRSAGWDYARIDAGRAGHPSSRERSTIDDHLSHPCGELLQENYHSPPWSSEEGRRWALAALVPIHIARLQKTLLYLLRNGQLSLSRRKWRIAVLERDVPGAELAIRDFRDLLGALFDLEGEGRDVPEIELRTYRSEEKTGLELPSEEPDHRLSPGEDPPPFDAELLMDSSVLLRPSLRPTPTSFADQVARQGVRATVRTAHAPTTESKVKGGRPIRYDMPPALGDSSAGDEEAEKHPQLRPLLYFLRNLFRKESYRPNQVDILRESLQGKDVIGLLPTGAGKSLTYHLSVLLQPGISMVVAPLKSLMHDQHANLKRAGIGSVLFIDSSLTPEERRRAQEMMKSGERQFVFISPERLQIQRFRDHLARLDVPVTYTVVDEAHCVSEWGHDFRTAYLRLGPNARSHCPSEWSRLPIIALTGTASFDVLADVRRELGFGEETETITPESMEREELEFEIVGVSPPNVEEDAGPWEVKKSVFEQKKRALPSVLQEMPDWFEEKTSGAQDSSEKSSQRESGENEKAQDRDDFFELKGDRTRSGLVFTPHANGDFGVQSLANQAKKGVPPLRGRVGTFASSDRDQEEEDRQDIQEEYKENELSALVATKAFGMGIDKPNIRYVVHMNMSQSIESYYQQAGRAGRDGNPARCVILYCDQEVPVEEDLEDGEAEQSAESTGSETITVDQELLRFFHESSFKGPQKEKRIVYDLLTGDADPEGKAPDLQALVQNMESGSPPETVAIKFENRKVIEEITSYLSQKADRGFNRRIVSLACEKAKSGDGLPKKLKWAFKQIRNEWPEWGALNGHESWLYSRFQRLRDRQDTFRAVYRLSTIGLIGDYTVDYNAGVIRADVQNLGAAGFIQELREYIGRYVAPEQAREIPEEVMQHPGENVVQKCLGYLVDFVYETIAQKRKMAASVMEEAIQEGIEQGDEAFRRRVNTYFDSRYLPVLQRRVQDREFNLALVWEFIEETGGTDDDVNHLRGACDRLLSEYTENGALYLLRAYTRCLMDGGRIQEFREDFREGWRLFREVKGLSRAEYTRALSRYRNMLSDLDNRLQGALDEEIAHAHASWLKAFNRDFLLSEA